MFITLKNISYITPSGIKIFKNVTLNIDSTWKTGLMGPNGAGKSTLLNILRKRIAPSGGQISNNIAAGYFSNTFNSKISLSITVNQYIHNHVHDLSSFNKMWYAFKLKDQLKNQFLKSLSSGELTKLLLSLLLSNHYDYYILDEPTVSLDTDGINTLKDILNAKNGFLIASHDANFLSDLTNHTMIIDNQQIYLYKTNTLSATNTQRRVTESQDKQRQREKKSIKLLKQKSTTLREWDRKSNSDNTKFIKRAKSIEKKINKLTKQIPNIAKEIKNNQLNSVSTYYKATLTVENFSVGYNEYPLFNPISFSAKPGKIISLHGHNGIGKSSFLNFINHTASSQLNSIGKLHISTNAITLVSKTQTHRQSILKLSKNNYGTDFINGVHKLGIVRDKFNTPIINLSSGEQKKIDLLLSLLDNSALVLWDEPSNYIDVRTIQMLIDFVKIQSKTIVVVDHNFDFLKHISDQIINLSAVMDEA
ncbi:ATP-binding cassette domain-containing protein [Pediococcus ethanolidurans]|uniref:ATP-binding cassette domain-containing protein n=1 Tax=Pediococcus ethanolidurans TaxID=319653 RepID=UPI0029544FF2|nr:ATP-binding cassette domain-containing protein [Pediococcus ethanolidurans]MDV7719865.1 ATP-binding cassette domain-containing protein [Pediococcus ethanolidurans]